MDREIIYAGDPLCAWCFGFTDVFNTIREAFDGQIRFSMVMGGLKVSSSVIISPEIKGILYQNWSAVVKRTGQAIALDKLHELPEGSYNSEPPCRAVVTARTLDPDLGFSYYKALHRAFYLDMKNINDPDFLCGLARNLGIDEGTFVRLYESDAIIDETRKDFETSKESGVLGYPALILKDDTGARVLNQGYKPLDQIRKGIDGWLNHGAPPLF